MTRTSGSRPRPSVDSELQAHAAIDIAAVQRCPRVNGPAAIDAPCWTQQRIPICLLDVAEVLAVDEQVRVRVKLLVDAASRDDLAPVPAARTREGRQSPTPQVGPDRHARRSRRGRSPHAHDARARIAARGRRARSHATGRETLLRPLLPQYRRSGHARNGRGARHDPSCRWFVRASCPSVPPSAAG